MRAPTPIPIYILTSPVSTNPDKVPLLLVRGRGQRETVHLEVVVRVGYVEVPGGWLGAKYSVELPSVDDYVAESACERWS